MSLSNELTKGLGVGLHSRARFLTPENRALLGTKTTRLACATPSSNKFWRFPLELPSKGPILGLNRA